MIARWISIVGHPFAMVIFMVAAVTVHRSPPGEVARTLALVAILTVVPVTALMLLQVRRGAWENVDASNVRERPLLFKVAGAALLVAVAYFLTFEPESFVTRGAVGTLAMLAVCALATRWMKISLHMAFAALATTTLLLLHLPAGWLLLAMVPLLAWSRLKLSRHRPAEVAAGVVVGAAAGVGIYWL